MFFKKKEKESRSIKRVIEAERKLSFTAAESYKMLRTKINLVLPQVIEVDGATSRRKCRVIGITSSMRGEGKSTTALHLAMTIAEAGRRVCIIEADMRLPNLAKRLGIEATPGLSNILSGQCETAVGIQHHATVEGIELCAVTAGDIPPMPSELLESKAMEELLNMLAERFDTIIVDLPPVSLVTDALSVSKLLDGMLLVVRRYYCDKRILRDVMYQIQLTGTKVIGVVMNCSDAFGGSASYYSKKRYKSGYKYYKKNYGYGYGYGNSSSGSK